MTEAIASPPAISPAPVLAYRTSTAPLVGVRVEPTPTNWVLELHPPTIGTELKKSVSWASMVSVALALTPLVMIHLLRSRGFDPRVGPAAGALVFLTAWPLMFAGRLVAGLAQRVTLRIEVSPAALCWTVSGFRLRYETVRPRDDIAAVELRLHGVRLKHRGGGGDWIAFGTRDQQRQMCLLLAEALNVPVRGVRKPPPPAEPASP